MLALFDFINFDKASLGFLPCKSLIADSSSFFLSVNLFMALMSLNKKLRSLSRSSLSPFLWTLASLPPLLFFCCFEPPISVKKTSMLPSFSRYEGPMISGRFSLVFTIFRCSAIFFVCTAIDFSLDDIFSFIATRDSLRFDNTVVFFLDFLFSDNSLIFVSSSFFSSMNLFTAFMSANKRLRSPSKLNFLRSCNSLALLASLSFFSCFRLLISAKQSLILIFNSLIFLSSCLTLYSASLITSSASPKSPISLILFSFSAINDMHSEISRPASSNVN